MSHYDMDVEAFKDHHFWEKFHKGFGAIGPTLTPLFLGPFVYFAARRHIKMYLSAYLGCVVFSAVGATAGHGMWIVE